MSRRLFYTLLCLMFALCANAQVNIREASVTKTTVHDALTYLASYSGATDNGTIHLDITSNVTEPATCYETPSTGQKGTVFEIANANITKIVISGNGNKHRIIPPKTVSPLPLSQIEGCPYKIRFKGAAELELSSLAFGKAGDKGYNIGWVASTASSSSTARTYVHGCDFDNMFYMDNVPDAYQSDVYEFDGNNWNENDNYAFSNQNPENKKTSVIFNNNTVTRFRAVSVFPRLNASYNQNAPVDVTMKNNTFYHLCDYSSHQGISSAVSLCQVTGPIYGNYDIENNTVLGIFTPGEKQGQIKATAVLLQHGNNGYQGIVDGSSIKITGNTVQCDVYLVGWKAQQTGDYDTGDVTDLVLNGTYYNMKGDDKQTGKYAKEIKDQNIVHMYRKDGATHSDSDACHVCYACGQMVLRAEVLGHGGTFQYEGSDHKMHDVSSASATIVNNLYPTDVQPGVDLKQKIVHNIVRDGFCLNPGKSQEFVITPTIKNDFKKLVILGGPVSPKDVTPSAVSTDGGKTYKYTYTNDFTQAAPYTACPHLIATIGHVSISIKCEGLVAGESALFDVMDNAGQVLFVVSLNSENPKKTVSGLEAGEYTIVPHNGNGHEWQWTYTMDPSSPQSSTITVAEGEHTFEFTATKGKPSVKNGEDYKDNKLSSTN